MPILLSPSRDQLLLYFEWLNYSDSADRSVVFITAARAPTRTLLKGNIVVCVIPVGFRLEWEFVVSVRNGRYDDRVIAGPREARRFLQEDFQIRCGHQYWTAVAACTGALRYRCHLEVARTCFVVAYAEYMVKISANS